VNVKVVARGRESARSVTGQTLVEFALVLPIFLLILLGLFDVGRYVYMNSVLSQAARDGARVAAVEAGWIGSSDAGCGSAGGPVCPPTVTGATSLLTDVTAAVNRMVAPFGPVPSTHVYISCDATTPPTGAWTIQSCNSTSNGSLVSVRVVLTFNPITPGASGITTITASGAATMAQN
jgi:TadE-like protein